MFIIWLCLIFVGICTINFHPEKVAAYIPLFIGLVVLFFDIALHKCESRHTTRTPEQEPVQQPEVEHSEAATESSTRSSESQDGIEPYRPMTKAEEEENNGKWWWTSY